MFDPCNFSLVSTLLIPCQMKAVNRVKNIYHWFTWKLACWKICVRRKNEPSSCKNLSISQTLTRSRGLGGFFLHKDNGLSECRHVGGSAGLNLQDGAKVFNFFCKKQRKITLFSIIVEICDFLPFYQRLFNKSSNLSLNFGGNFEECIWRGFLGLSPPKLAILWKPVRKSKETFAFFECFHMVRKAICFSEDKLNKKQSNFDAVLKILAAKFTAFVLEIN